MVLSLFVIPYDTIVPIFAKVIFKGNAATFGFISSFMGGGAILASLFMASLKKGAELKMVLLSAVVILGIGLIFFSRITWFPLAMPFAVVIGFGSILPMTTGITIIQVEAAPHMRGRVMSYIAMAFFGMLPLGSLLVGALSQKITAPLTMLCEGIMAIVIAAVFYRFMKTEKLDKKDRERLEEAEDIVTKNN
jgi:MFS family permease